MRLRRVLLGRRAETDMRLARNHRRLFRLLRRLNSRINRHRVMTVAALNMPTGRGKTFLLVGDVRQRNLTVNRDVIVVPQHDQLAQLLHARQTDRLMADALHQAPVTGNHISVVIDNLLAEPRTQRLFGHRETHRIGNALT